MKHHPQPSFNITTVIKDFAFWLREYVHPWVLEANLPRHQDDQFRRIPHVIVTAAENFDQAVQNRQAKRKKLTKRTVDLTIYLNFIHEVLYDKVELCAIKNPILITNLNKSPTKAIDIYSKNEGLHLIKRDYVALPTLKIKAKAFYEKLTQYQQNLMGHPPTVIEKMIIDWMDDHSIGIKQAASPGLNVTG